ncbi:MAG: ATP-binding protein [Streptosporangiaceae bacterium]
MTRPIRRVFPGQDSQVRCARDFIRRTVGGSCTMLDEAILLTSELCTNALQHTGSGAGGSFEVTVLRAPACVRIEVRDEGSRSLPAARDCEQLTEDGRGLEIVRLLAHRWGQKGDEYGRSVFFELRCGCP